MKYPDNIDRFSTAKEKFESHVEKFSVELSRECEILADRTLEDNKPEYTTRMIDDANRFLRSGRAKYHKSKINWWIPITNFLTAFCGAGIGASWGAINDRIGLAFFVGTSILTLVSIVWNYTLVKGEVN